MNDLSIVILLAIATLRDSRVASDPPAQISKTARRLSIRMRSTRSPPRSTTDISPRFARHFPRQTPNTSWKPRLRTWQNRRFARRRAVARRFLKGLHEDFSNLAKLGRIIAALSPEVSHEQETERLILSLKFQILYTLVWLRLSTGNLPLQQLEHLTGLVGRLATRMDEAMAEDQRAIGGPLAGGLGA